MSRISSDERRAEIAGAVWRIVLRDGLPAATVRAVADEAGMSTGSLRHFFGTQAELLLFTWNHVAERAEARIRAAGADTSHGLRAAALAVCEQFLPLDDTRRAEMQVWNAFVVAAQTDATLADVRDRTDAAITTAFRSVVADLQRAGVVDPRLPVEREAARLHALLDGLAAHGVDHPGRMTPALQRDILVAHLDSLAPPTGSTPAPPPVPTT